MYHMISIKEPILKWKEIHIVFFLLQSWGRGIDLGWADLQLICRWWEPLRLSLVLEIPIVLREYVDDYSHRANTSLFSVFISSLTRTLRIFIADLPSHNCSKSNKLNFEVFIWWALEKKLHLSDMSSTYEIF